MPMRTDELLKSKRQEILLIAAKHGAHNLRVFGSVARGEAKRSEKGTLGDDQDYFIWWSLIHGLEAIRSRKDKIKRMLLS
jgi:hypothetical protein